MIRENLKMAGQIVGVALVYVSLIGLLIYPALHAARLA